ncbi:MAG: WD40/YVTN/BNR-like repeat-containing protein [Micromonosporaceae bacterium]
MDTVLAIGTRKGLFLARSADRLSWAVTGPHLPMTEVYAVGIDARHSPPRLLVGATSSHFGPSVIRSDDLGESWQEPEQAPIAFAEDTDTSLERVWQLAPGRPDAPEEVWAGTQPSALFGSADGGKTFSLVRALWDHPHRPEWGAGFGGQAIHTVLPHPTDPQRIVVAMSTGGVYRSEDGGESWQPGNTGVKAYFLPDDQYPEFGQCVHKVARDSQQPERLYLQNHHGVYRSDDDGKSWQSIADGLPTDFGFAMVAHPHRSGVIWNFPIEADGRRFPPEQRARVYRSEDAGASWAALDKGLPDEPFCSAVMRDAMCADNADPAGVYFGSRSGEVYASADEGDTWRLVASHLPDVLSVRAAVVG